jgi:hypothetical protein
MRFQKTPHFHHTKLQGLFKLTHVKPLVDIVLKYVENFLDVKTWKQRKDGDVGSN